MRWSTIANPRKDCYGSFTVYGDEQCSLCGAETSCASFSKAIDDALAELEKRYGYDEFEKIASEPDIIVV